MHHGHSGHRHGLPVHRLQDAIWRISLESDTPADPADCTLPLRRMGSLT